MIVGLAMLGAGAGAGLFGSLLGLGGGTLIVPLLTLGFGLPLRDAVGVSLVAVIVTSSASASVFLQRHAANLRLGMTLELFTATGAIVGGIVAFALDVRLLAGLFAALLVYVGLSMVLRRGAPPAEAEASPPQPTTTHLPPARRSMTPRERAPARALLRDSRGRAIASTGSVPVSPEASSRGSSRPCSASAAGRSKCRSCTSRWGCRCASRRRRATS